MMMQIRSTLAQLATKPCPSSVALSVAKPAAAVLPGRFLSMAQSRPFATKPKRDEELINKSYGDAFDESDALEKGKEKVKANVPTTTRKPTYAEQALRRHYESPLWRSFGFDDFFTARDPFAPFFSSRFHDPFSGPRIMPVIKRFPPFVQNTTLLRSSPGYEIKESDSTYEIAIDIPEGVRASDMKVELEQDGTVLHVSGERKVEEDGSVTQTRFDQHFSIGDNIDTEQLTANLSDNVLVLKAPKVELEELDDTKRTIAISEKPHEFSDEELRQANFGDAFDESDWVETGKSAKTAKQNE